MKKSYTFTIIKPDISKERRDEINEEIKKYGFKIVCSKPLLMTKEMVFDLYGEEKINKYSDLLKFMTSGESLVQILYKEYEKIDKKNNACFEFRQLVNPKQYDEKGNKIKKENNKDMSSKGPLRQKFGTDSTRNAVHGSNNHENFIKEIKIFFTKEDLKDFLSENELNSIFNTLHLQETKESINPSSINH